MKKSPLSTASTRQALMAGRSPQSWQRHLLREIAWLGDLPLAYAWVRPLEHPVSCQLNRQPLLGHGLAALTQSPVEEGRSNPPSGRSPQVRPSSQPSGDGMTPVTRFANPTQGASRIAAVKVPVKLQAGDRSFPEGSPFQLAPQAASTLLSHLAGAAIPSPSWHQPSAPIHLPSAPAKPLPPVETDQTWQRQLTQRVQQSLHLPWQAAEQIIPVPPATPTILAAPADPAPPSADPWAAPLAGRTVPLSWLTELTDLRQVQPQGPPVTGSSPAKSASQPQPDRYPTRSPSTSAWIAPGATRGRSHPPGEDRFMPQPGFTDSSMPAAPWDSAAPASATNAPWPLVSGGISSAHGDEQPQPYVHPAEAIEPPTRQPLLPELLPPQGGSISSTTAPTIRQAIHQEDRGEDELNWLSVSLKRILDEEARRHGIDV
ncbi:MAG TPA: hypothetical protein V6C57_06710 [Coleofasciculaceae cyanobacterium]